MPSIVINGFEKTSIRNFVWFCCNHLNIYPKTIEVGTLEADGMRGICIDNDEDDFTILLKPGEHQLQTLAHEMVHVKQYMKQNLGSLLDQAYNYENCWWEVEARLLSRLIIQEYHELKKETQLAA